VELFIIAIGMIVLAAFAIAATVSGVDSRDLSDDEHRSSYPVGIS
jgi:hypothetical protein